VRNEECIVWWAWPWVDVKFVFYQCPGNSRHISELSCKDVSIFLDEFDERGFLFGVLRVRLRERRNIVDQIHHFGWRDPRCLALSMVRSDSDSPDTTEQCLGHALEARPTRAGVGGDRSMLGPKLSYFSGSFMLRSPNWLAIKCRDPKINLGLGENLANAWSPSTSWPLPDAPTVSVYDNEFVWGAHESGNRCKHNGTQRFLDRFGPSQG
jgi:hypothetical protein